MAIKNLAVILTLFVGVCANRFAPCGPAELIEQGCINPPVDVCIAVDMSGSVCAPPTGSHHCLGCDDDCHEQDFTKNLCCSTFDNQINFATDLADYITIEIPHSRFALVSFATEAQLDSPLVDKTTFRSNAANLDYRGGWTNTGNALQICYDILKDTTNDKVVVLITDGTPTAGNPDFHPAYRNEHKEWATEQANIIKGDDIELIPILVSTKLSDNDYLESLSSDPSYVTKVEDFHALKDDLEAVVDIFVCQPEPVEPYSELPLNNDGCRDDPVDLCVAVDMSGSVCTPASHETGHNCMYCNDVCHEDGFDKNVCCSTFQYQMNFAEMLSDYVTAEVSSARFSLVSFGTEAIKVSDLTSQSGFIHAIDDLDYSGGWTDTGNAIRLCYETLKDTSNKRVILIVTDGTPTAGNPHFDPAYIQEHKHYATQQANVVKADGIKLIPVLVSTKLSDNDYLESLASYPSYVTKVEQFYELEDELDDIVDMVKCDAQTEPPVTDGCLSEPIGLCIAVDMSGSVCTPSWRKYGHHCTDCSDLCHEEEFSKSVCCSTFNYQMTFAEDLAMYVSYLVPRAQFSLVSFGTDAILDSDLTSLNGFRYKVASLDYRGGWTNTGKALELCHETVKDFPNEKVVVLVTDGTPTAGHPDFEPAYRKEHKQWATAQADLMKADGVRIIPVLVSTKLSDNKYLESLASDPDDVNIVEDFSNLEDNLDDIVRFVKCDPNANQLS